MKLLGTFFASFSLLLVVLHAGAARTPDGRSPDDPPPPDDLPANTPTIRLPLAKQEGAHRNVKCVAFTPDGRAVIASDSSGLLLRFDPATGERLAGPPDSLQWFGGSCSSITFSPDGRLLVASIVKNTLALLDLETGRPRLSLESPPLHKNFVFFQQVAFSPDGRAVAAGLDSGEVALWDATTGRLRAVLPAFIAPERRISGKYPHTVPSQPAMAGFLYFTPDSKTLLSTYGFVRIWDVATGQETGRLDEPYRIGGGVLSPDGRTLIILRPTTEDPFANPNATQVDLWDLESRRKTVNWATPDPISLVAFLPDGRGLVTLEEERVVRIRDVATGRSRAAVRFEEQNHLDRLAVSPDGKRIAAAGYTTSKIFGIIQLLETDGQTLRPWKPEP